MATIVPTTTTTTTTTMRPYRNRGPIDYDRLDYDPNEPVQKPDAMEQNLQLRAIYQSPRSPLYTDFDRRPDVSSSMSNTILCYDLDDLNVRVSPDVYLAFGVDAQAIRPRKLYLPWEVGKPPGLGAGGGLVEYRPSGYRPQAGDLCPDRRAGILAF